MLHPNVAGAGGEGPGSRHLPDSLPSQRWRPHWPDSLYLAHLAIILWWLLDKSPRHRATTALIALLKQALPASALTLRLPRVRAFVLAGDKLFREALFDEAAEVPLQDTVAGLRGL